MVAAQNTPSRLASHFAAQWGALIILVGAAIAPRATAAPADADGFRVPDGFAVSLFADDLLAHDIYAMTCDAHGRVVVAGPGYIKTLHDDNGDGIADRASLYSDLPRSGAQGLCFAGRTLLASGDGGLLRFEDQDDDGRADGPPEVWARLRSAEHGAHAIVQGPDGWFYVVCGNDSGLGKQHVNSPTSPVVDPRCGGILRISPDGKRREVVAHGFRNPYDIDFTSGGNLLTVDSDGERDQHLPWYEPTRMFDVALGREHGWLEGGWTKSWSRPECFFDNVDRVCEFGRGSPTGLVVYRHRQFPKHYRGGAFAACWTFGRVYFVPLAVEGSTLRGRPETFAATAGENGFAPVDLAVGPAGDLFVAIGGRKTRGGVYRIRYQGADAAQPVPLDSPTAKLDVVLTAAQPLSAWSRAEWLPLAEQLGPAAFGGAIADSSRPVDERVRAVEVLGEVFGHRQNVLDDAIRADPALACRAAWSLGRGFPTAKVQPPLLAALQQQLLVLTASDSAQVQRAAWEALAFSGLPAGESRAEYAWERGLASGDRRVRAALIAFARGAGRARYQRWAHEARQLDSPWAEAARLRIAGVPDGRERLNEFLVSSLAVYASTADSGPRLEALRLMQLALGDVRLAARGQEGIPGYSCQLEPPLEQSMALEVAETLAKDFPTGNDRLNREIARTMGLVQCAPQLALDRIAALAADQPTAAEALHYLFVLTSVNGPRSVDATQHTATALARLHGQLAARGEHPSRNWPELVEQAFDRLIAVDDSLPPAFVDSAQFGRPEQALFLRHLPGACQTLAARRLFEWARDADDPEAWTPELIAALRAMPAATWQQDEVLTALRPQWEDFRLRDEIALWLAAAADKADRDRLVEALASPQSEVVSAAASGLLNMSAGAAVDEIAATLGALRQASAGEPSSIANAPQGSPASRSLEERLWQQGAPLRAKLIALVRHASGKTEQHLPDQAAGYRAWRDWFRKTYPDQAARALDGTGIDSQAWGERLTRIDWALGERSAGEKLFEKQACHRCHRGDNRLGPDLAGAVTRMTRDDLFAAIYDPQREVAPPYRTTLLATRSGQVHHGLVIYESPDGTLLQTAPDTTVRVAGDELSTMQPSNRSLMPSGLLDGLSDRELADLAAYLATLAPTVGAPSIAAPTTVDGQ